MSDHTFIRLSAEYKGHGEGQVVKVTAEELEAAIDAGVVERYFDPGAQFGNAPTLDRPVAKKSAAAPARKTTTKRTTKKAAAQSAAEPSQS
jgi:hypothetical protein